MEHIYRNHMAPAASGKSYFSTTSRNQVRNLVLSAISHPDVGEPHRWCADKVLYKSASLVPSGYTEQAAYRQAEFVW